MGLLFITQAGTLGADEMTDTSQRASFGMAKKAFGQIPGKGRNILRSRHSGAVTGKKQDDCSQ